MSNIAAYFNDKRILLTGGTGFMGKILVEKLLYSCPGLDKIYLLLRPKKGKTPAERILDMSNLLLFHRIRDEYPERFAKLVVINGDLSKEDNGISDEDRQTIEDNVDIVIHNAAVLRLDTKLKYAVNMNVTGTLRLLEMATNMKKLKVFIHISTAFCHMDHEILEEKTYPAKVDPKYIMELTKWMDDETLELITPRLLHPHPNSYTYTKRLSEKVVEQFYPRLPIVIIRPSIVTPTYSEPIPGFTDNLNGPAGLLLGAGKGVIRSILGDPDEFAQCFPADMTINAILLITSSYNKINRNEGVPVFNVTNGDTNGETWGEIIEHSKAKNYEYPFSLILWLPGGKMYKPTTYGKIVHRINVIFFHWLPAYLIDGIMVLIGRERFLVNVQRRIQDGMGMLQYFTSTNWKFINKQFLELRNLMNEEDKKIFDLDIESKELDSYYTNCCLTCRKTLLNEDPSTIPRARRMIKIMKLHFMAVAWILFLQF